MVTSNRLYELILPLLKAKSRLFSKSITSVELEDIESELWLHIFENMPYFETLRDTEIKALASIILKNKAISLYRKHCSRTRGVISYEIEHDSVKGTLDSILSLELAYLGLNIFDRGLHQLTQESVFEYKELVSVIDKWSKSQDKLSQKLIKEILNPSKETIIKWNELVKKFPIYRSYEYIPYCSYTRLIGISRPKIIKTMKALKVHLKSIYSEDFAMMLS